MEQTTDGTALSIENFGKAVYGQHQIKSVKNTYVNALDYLLTVVVMFLKTNGLQTFRND